MKLPDKLYDILKWIGLVFLPAIAWFIGEVGGDIGIQNVESVVRIITAVGTFLGLILGVSCYSYNKEGEE